MARPEEAKSVKAFRAAKTGKEMVYSWGSQSPGRNMEPTYNRLKLFADKAPWLIESYCHKPLADIMDRGILDRKTRELVMIGMMLTMNSAGGVAAHVANAKAAGVTEEEILEVAALACYEQCKVKAVDCSAALADAFKFSEKVTVYEP
ncbi:MAG: carboxymuconolactone decarboxylase family protein [Chloroflexi bacterium]|nr:carboxymuconolactone decarboxylase family protein [Chloroflexota bacterium]